jgi:anti-anti-sigma factor
MTIREQRHGAVTVLTPQGAVCTDDAAEFKRVAEAAAQKTLGRLVIDMSESPFLDSLGIEALLDLGDLLAQSGHGVCLCGECDTVREILDLVGVSESFEHFADVNTAVRSFL